MTRHLSIVTLGGLAILGIAASAQTVKVEGLIQQRSGATMTVKTANEQVVVVLTPRTKVGQKEGLLKVRRKEMSMAALIPGLSIQAEGTYDAQHQLIAESVAFDGNDLERAQSIEAGLHETRGQAEANREVNERQQAELAAQQERIGANRAMIQAAVARFGQLDDYYILDEVTVLFGSGKAAVEAQYKPRLLELAKKSKTIEGYMVQVVGYASASGSAALNQKLSQDRAANVTNFLLQEGDIPLTNVLAPGAMGESRQIGDENTADGEAQNRRVVVRILQNKGVAGLQEKP